MRRAPLVLAGTVTGLVLVLGYRPPDLAARRRGHDRRASPAQPPGSTPGARAAANRTVTGGVVPTRYGDAQVRVTATDGKLTEVTAVQLPDDDRRPSAISWNAEPTLRSDALAGQSADIDTVSGATYTGDGSAESLQSALDQRGLG